MTFLKRSIIQDSFLKQKYLLWASLFPLLVTLLLSLTIWLFFKYLPSKLPLFYSLPWGDKQLATHQQFFIIPSAIILISLVNLFIAWHLHKSQLFFKLSLIITSIITTIILTTSFFKIIFLFI